MLNYADANEILMNEFEETRRVFHEDGSFFGGEYISHCFYESALVPYIVKLLNEDHSDELKISPTHPLSHLKLKQLLLN